MAGPGHKDYETTPPPRLEVIGLAKSFGAVVALRKADLKVHAGEVVALAGDNGAGKSTLIKILSGIISPDEGTMLFDGRPVALRQPNDAVGLGIQTVYQDLALCGNLDTIENIFLGRELRRSGWFGYRLTRAAMEKQARAILDSVGIKIQRLDQPVASLSGGQQQCIAVCRAILGDPKVVILDEPTAALGVTQTRDVLQLIERLRSQGRAVLVVSHDLQEVLTFADRIVVMRIGETVRDDVVSAWNEHSLVSAITGMTAGASI